MILVDTNVLVDVLADDPTWYAWSRAALKAKAPNGLVINDLVYAELAPRYVNIKALDDAVAEFDLTFERIPKAALYTAGRTFQTYRERGGIRTSLLPDFFIGAHAEVAGLTILTRDARRYRSYFPDVALIAPDLT